jgi:methyl-accepting chemotaxis protein
MTSLSRLWGRLSIRGLWGRASIRSQILAIAVLGVIGLVFAGALAAATAWSERRSTAEMDIVRHADVLVGKAVQAIADGRDAAETFMRTHDNDAVDRRSNARDRATTALASLAALSLPAATRQDLEQAQGALKDWDQRFDAVAAAVKKVGTDEKSGLHGALNGAAQDLAASVAAAGNAPGAEDRVTAQLGSLMAAMRQIETKFMLRGSPAVLGEMLAQQRGFAEAAKALPAAAQGNIELRLKAYQAAFFAFYNGYLAVPKAADALRASGNLLVDTLSALSTRLAANYAAKRTEMATVSKRALWAEGIGIAVLVLAIGTLGTLLARTVARRIVGLAHTMRALAGGDHGVTVAGTAAHDEIGVMAQAVQVFKDMAIEAERLAAQQSEQQAAREERAQNLERLSHEFDTGVAGILERLGGSAGTLSETAQSMSATAEETSRQAAAAAAASTQASANVQTVAAATEQLAGSITEVGGQVTHSAEIARQAVDEAHRADATVKDLAAAAQRIGEVVALINQIAAQTNLLALNATIEAARAGDAGKGFAVVASEVKSLANQTTRATEDIRSQIGAIQGATTDTVEAIRGIGAIIDQMNSISSTVAAAIEQQRAATESIARDVTQTAGGTNAVSENVAGVSSAADATGTAAAQVLDAARQMTGETEALHRIVDDFLTRIRTA